jgi:phosphatidylserine/phosphatidylglycerophosphate/cardiolipin synthase-like enzyme
VPNESGCHRRDRRAGRGRPFLRGLARRDPLQPGGALDRIDAELIDNSETSIDMAAYVLSDWEVIEALDNAAARGVRVRVILDPREHSAVDRMAGLHVRMKAPGPLQHLKAFVIDGATLPAASANFFRSGEQEQDNDLILVRDPQLAARFELNFGRMWTAAVPAMTP